MGTSSTRRRSADGRAGEADKGYGIQALYGQKVEALHSTRQGESIHGVVSNSTAPDPPERGFTAVGYGRGERVLVKCAGAGVSEPRWLGVAA